MISEPTMSTSGPADISEAWYRKPVTAFSEAPPPMSSDHHLDLKPKYAVF
jgi:hypothetical protein